MDRAVDEKLLNEVLRCERLQQPKAQADVLLKRVSDELQVVDEDGSLLGAQCYRQEERNNELVRLKLVIGAGLLEVEVRRGILAIVLILLDLDVQEDAQDLVDEVSAEYCLIQPELLVLRQNHVLHAMRNLWRETRGQHL